jgi:hypothetical protein
LWQLSAQSFVSCLLIHFNKRFYLKFHLDDSTYRMMLQSLDSLHLTDGVGEVRDLDFIKDDIWLYDTAVIENLERRRGTWEINLLFAHYQQPLKFLSRRITSETCPKKAALTASLMRRQAAKDQRGTLTIKLEDLNLPEN